MSRSRQLDWKLLFAVFLLLAASIEFVSRGPVRFLRLGYQWSDISQVYISSQAWTRGLSPYSSDNFVALCRQATGTSPGASDIRTHSTYPLTTLVIVSPLAALPWPLAHVLWASVLGVIPVLLIWAMATLGRLSNRRITCLFAGLILALAPLHTGVAVGNVSIPAIAISAFAVWAGSVRKDIAAGLLLGVATCLKPQLCICFVLYYALRKRWQIVLFSAGLTAAVLVVGVLRLEISGAHWLSDFLHNARQFVVDNPTVDFSEKDPIRFTLIDLQVLIYSLSGSIAKARVGALLVSVALLSGWFWLGFKSDRRPPELLTLSTLVVLNLFPVYHRNYDATVLVFPICWFLSTPECLPKKIAGTGFLLVMLFALPGAVLLQQLARAGRISSRIVKSGWWNTFVMPHETWALLFLSILLLYAMALTRGREHHRRPCRTVPVCEAVLRASSQSGRVAFR